MGSSPFPTPEPSRRKPSKLAGVLVTINLLIEIVDKIVAHKDASAGTVDKRVEAADLNNSSAAARFLQLTFGLFSRECGAQGIEKVFFQNGMLVGGEQFNKSAALFREWLV
jgi:hypothetical protein